MLFLLERNLFSFSFRNFYSWNAHERSSSIGQKVAFFQLMQIAADFVKFYCLQQCAKKAFIEKLAFEGREASPLHLLLKDFKASKIK